MAERRETTDDALIAAHPIPDLCHLIAAEQYRIILAIARPVAAMPRGKDRKEATEKLRASRDYWDRYAAALIAHWDTRR